MVFEVNNVNTGSYSLEVHSGNHDRYSVQKNVGFNIESGLESTII